MKGGGFMERSASDSPYHERKIKQNLRRDCYGRICRIERFD